MKKKLLILFFVLTFSLFSFKSVKALEMEATNDSFILLEDSYDADEKFVYTVRANFISGQAAGLVFGAKENEYYYVLNMDRVENMVKLIYFSKKTEGEGYDTEELYREMFIGNDKMTQAEKDMVFPKVRNVENVDFKVIITPEDDKVYAEFYVDGIKRFGVDNTIILDERYQGGNLGYNVFNAKVDFTDVEIGKSDYSYYTEMYRQQYHYSQFKNWNNDPNGLVYYDGYYHLFFQHHPFSKYWSDMYWGHARSKDLVHWEQLPICVFPDQYGYAWSGSAMVYEKGTNSIIDSWFTHDTGLLAFYTADGAKQNQIIMSSDDGGMTWTKHYEYVISQDLVPTPTGFGEKFDCRDPRVFIVEDKGMKLYGMVVSGMNPETVWLLQSTDMLHWSFATKFNLFRPECVDVVRLTADDNTLHTVLTFEGREYLVGEFKINDENKIYFEKYSASGNFDVTNKTKDEINASKMDYGPDSYATQSFYISDPNSKYYGKAIALSWFSGVPGGEASAESGMFAEVRTKWNGSGFTIPVEYGLKKVGDQYVLTQTPITLDNTDFDKDEIVNISNLSYKEDSENVLSDVDTHQLEIFAKFDNPNKEEIEFKINIGEGEYTTVGWNETDGYYVDRTNTSDGGINFGNYHRKYTTGPVDTVEPTFYILSDNGSIEVFCEDFTKPFYVLTLASVHSTKASLNVSGEVTIKELKVNKIKSVFYDEDLVTDEGVVYLSKTDARLDLNLTTEDNILLYTTLNVEPTWEIVSGEDVITLETHKQGATVKALAVGEAVVKVTCGNVTKEVKVKVETGASVSDIDFNKDGIVSGNWYQTSTGLIGKQSAGDGFILSNKSVTDCYYTAQFNLGSGAAAALVLRAKADMSDYIIVNYDKNSNIVKAWTPRKELVNVGAGHVDTSNITLTTVLEGNKGTIILDGRTVATFQLTEEDSKEGLLGLNVCATEATFKAVTLQDLTFEYNGGDLVIVGNVNQYINKITNITLKNQIVDKSFISVSGRNITISKDYFTTLTLPGVYQFDIYGTASRMTITVNVKELPEVGFDDVLLVKDENLNIYLGNVVVSSITLNDVVLRSDQYSIRNYVLRIDSSLLNLGKNKLLINDEEIIITVKELVSSDVEDIPTEDVPTEDTPTVEPTEEPTEDTPTEEVPTEGVTEEVPTEEIPTEDEITEEVPTEGETEDEPTEDPNPTPNKPDKKFNILYVIIPAASVLVITLLVAVIIYIKKKREMK